jgi:hypothetical protein
MMKSLGVYLPALMRASLASRVFMGVLMVDVKADGRMRAPQCLNGLTTVKRRSRL